MLPSELARYKIQGDEIIPLFASLEDKEIAEDVISLFREGRKLGEVIDDIKILEKIYNIPSKIKLIRGFYKVMLRQCELLENSPIEPREIRREIFSYGPVLSEEERNSVLRTLNEKLNVDVEKFMFADMDEEKKIIRVNRIDPVTLIKMYNLSLLQTLLFKSYKLTVRMEGDWKEIIKRIKWLGLMYFAYPNPLKIEIIGPASLVKMTEKYGRNMAVLIPYIVSSKIWKIRADIVLGNKIKRVYKMNVEKFELIDSFTSDEEKKRFDSSVEEKFYQDFTRVIHDWKLIREPEVEVVNNRLFIPDFVAIKEPLKVYIEIVGFWTKEYIKEKLEKLSGFSKNLLILLNEELNKEDFNNFNVIKYKRRVDIGIVYKWLKDFEAKNYREFRLDYTINGEVVSISDIAKKLGVSESLVRKNLKQFENYVLLKNYYIRKDFLEKIAKENFENRKLSDLINAYGNYITEVLEYLGYKFKWVSITNAIIIRDKK